MNLVDLEKFLTPLEIERAVEVGGSYDLSFVGEEEKGIKKLINK